jgi:hypothetical protein
MDGALADEASVAEPFMHAPLDTANRQIRLLRFTKNKKSNIFQAKPPPACKLTHFDLGSPSCPPYKALSYAWGSTLTLQAISINGKTFHIRHNLFDYFELYCSASMAKNEYFWVDQICINQGVAEERNHQVQLMAEIYQSAAVVCIWLDGQKNMIRLQ